MFSPGLEDQLLGKVIQSEKAELEEMKNELQENMVRYSRFFAQWIGPREDILPNYTVLLWGCLCDWSDRWYFPFLSSISEIGKSVFTFVKSRQNVSVADSKGHTGIIAY